ncbi:MAG: hypothetical protein AAB452_02580 [Patescibacteria group bacterium]
MEKEKFESIGQARIDDMEKAHFVAAFEQLERNKADAYERYLQKPEASLMKDRFTFSMWESWKLSPADVQKYGEVTAEQMSKLYDIDKKIRQLENKGERYKLVGEKVLGLTVLALNLMRLVSFDTPRFYLSKMRNTSWWFGNEDTRMSWMRVKNGIYRVAVSQEALRRMNKRAPEGESFQWDFDQKTHEVLEEGEQYQIPVIRSYSESKKREGEVSSDKREDGEAVLEEVFEWIARRYGAYLKNEGESGGSFEHFFQEFKRNNVTPEDIRKEKDKTVLWLDAFSEWRARIEQSSQEELEEEESLNFYKFLQEIFSDEPSDRLDKVRALIAPVIKLYLLIKQKVAKGMEEPQGIPA